MLIHHQEKLDTIRSSRCTGDVIRERSGVIPVIHLVTKLRDVCFVQLVEITWLLCSCTGTILLQCIYLSAN